MCLHNRRFQSNALSKAQSFSLKLMYSSVTISQVNNNHDINRKKLYHLYSKDLTKMIEILPTAKNPL